MDSHAVAMRWVSVIMTACGEMVFPLLIGIWLDAKLALSFPVFTVLGLFIGFPLSLWHLLKTCAKMNEEIKR